ncbi:MAG: hypothetical protein U9R17_10050 [Thermodesulfobacteriota bacterium]|nr:hypothetical protein [Thermodesulfobacteriota bacterium]
MKVCMVGYTFYENDGRVLRYAETLAKRGEYVDVVALRRKGQSKVGRLNGVNIYRIQEREINEKNKFSMVSQTILPEKWVIVSDGPTDGTDEIVQRYTSK